MRRFFCNFRYFSRPRQKKTRRRIFLFCDGPMSLIAVGQRFTAQCAGTQFCRRGRCLHRPEPAAAASRGKCGGCEGGVHRRTSVAAVGARIARQDTYDMRAPPSNVPGRDSTVGADAYIGPNPPQAGPFDESAQAARARLPPAGDFSRGEEFPKRAGAAAPGPPLGPAACIPRSGITQAAALHLAVPSHTAHPFPASRGPVESTSRYGYRTFL